MVWPPHVPYDRSELLLVGTPPVATGRIITNGNHLLKPGLSGVERSFAPGGRGVAIRI